MNLGDQPTSCEVHDYDVMDDDDPEVPPQFAYEAYGSEMYRVYVKGLHDTKNGEDRIGIKA